MENKKIKVVKISSKLIPCKYGETLKLVFFIVDEKKTRYQYMPNGMSESSVDTTTEILATTEPGEEIEISYSTKKVGPLGVETVNKIVFVNLV